MSTVILTTAALLFATVLMFLIVLDQFAFVVKNAKTSWDWLISILLAVVLFIAPCMSYKVVQEGVKKIDAISKGIK